MALSTPWFQIFGLQNCGWINFCWGNLCGSCRKLKQDASSLFGRQEKILIGERKSEREKSAKKNRISSYPWEQLELTIPGESLRASITYMPQSLWIWGEGSWGVYTLIPVSHRLRAALKGIGSPALPAPIWIAKLAPAAEEPTQRTAGTICWGLATLATS